MQWIEHILSLLLGALVCKRIVRSERVIFLHLTLKKAHFAFFLELEPSSLQAQFALRSELSICHIQNVTETNATHKKNMIDTMASSHREPVAVIVVIQGLLPAI